MTPSRILTTVVLVVPPEREQDVVPAYRELVARGPRPDGVLRSELLRGQTGRWSVHTLWRDREALVAARGSGARPAALLLAEALGAEHSHDVLTLEETLQE